MSLQELVLFIHISAAIVWVGGSATVLIFGMRASASGDPERQLAFIGDVQMIGMKVFNPAGIILLISGIWLVIDHDAYGFDQAWISIAFTIVIIGALLGALFYGPQTKKVIEEAAANGADDAGVQRRVDRIFLVARIELVLLFVAVYAMVFKPGL